MLTFLKQFVFIRGKCLGYSHQVVKELSTSFFFDYFSEALYQKSSISSAILMSPFERVGVEFNPNFPAFWLSGMGVCVTATTLCFQPSVYL